jgi:septal ring factor EnvC (AmiA/AmiB activator)
VDAQPDAQPDKQLVEHISQQLVQVQCLAKQTAEAQQRSQQRLDTCAAELKAFHNQLLGHSTARQQIFKHVEALDDTVDAVSQQLGVLMLERSERSQQVNVIQPADSAADRQWRESTDDSILELHQSRIGFHNRVFKLEDRVDAISSNLDRYLGSFSR